MPRIVTVLLALLAVFTLAHARVDPAYLDMAAATGGEVIDTPRAVMAAGHAPMPDPRNNYFGSVEFVSECFTLGPHQCWKPVTLLRSGSRTLSFSLWDPHGVQPAGFVLLDAASQTPTPLNLPCRIDGKRLACQQTIRVPAHPFYFAVRYPTPSGEVLRIHPRKFKPVW
ncbi:hypothetical protein [Chitinilyticum piscinae]|uniref:Uncharacterized protein n=1 Tax=Chitinilyticum piscinae TaxID=2866724 RepID=A0A8J7FME6_9NEIS|nr:hypothetical protein [Chitinilyticum piscinae]MBE9609121.1 hypothetical protein [Chitinilyticum piscinae]